MIYLDNNATTALDPRVLKAMLLDLSGPPHNPSSVHSLGKRARAHLTEARHTVATFFHAKPSEVIFTSGGTESLNLLLRGLPPGHLITSSIEHSAILETLKTLPHLDVTYLSPTDPIASAIRPDTRAILLSLSNHETGVKIDLTTIANLAQKHSIPLLLDAVSFIGKEPFPHHPAIKAIAISAHKFHGPKGIGALITSLKLPSLHTGGGQESNLRSGTENLAGILGLAKALQILQEEQTQITSHLLSLRNHFESSLLSAIPNLAINGEGERICNVSNLAFPTDGETLLIQLDRLGLAASHGSACSSGAIEPSRILLNMGLDRKRAKRSLRFSFSRQNTKEEIDEAIRLILSVVRDGALPHTPSKGVAL